MSDEPTRAQSALHLIVGELEAVLGRLESAELEKLAQAVTGADRVFVHGAGRSGIALRMTAMRLMHLGLTVHVVGETTTPAIETGDILLVASGSGTTAGIVAAAEAAGKAGARIAALTTAQDQPASSTRAASSSRRSPSSATPCSTASGSDRPRAQTTCGRGTRTSNSAAGSPPRPLHPTEGTS